MQPEDELCHDTKVGAAAADAPEQVGIIRLARKENRAVGGDDRSQDQVANGEALVKPCPGLSQP